MSDPGIPALKRYVLHFGGAMAVYSGIVIASVWAINGLKVTGWRAGALSLTPMVPAIRNRNFKRPF